VLWGGLFMITGAILLLTYYGEKIREISAIITGIGWGLFIDEIGKYLTKDNNYWFQPAIIFIYISFVCLFLIYRYFDKQKNKNKKTLCSVIDQLEEMAEENKRGKFWKDLLTKTGYYSYNKIFKRKFILTILSVFAGVWAFERIREIWVILANPQRIETIKNFYHNYGFLTRADIYMVILKIIFDTIVAILFLTGLLRIASKRRIIGLKFFQWGLIINIFLSSVIKLYFEQFSEVFVLGPSILLLMALNRLKKELYS
jgi:hypothetical protein